MSSPPSLSPPVIVRKSNPLSRKRVVARTEDTLPALEVKAEPDDAMTDMPPPPLPVLQHRASRPAFDIVEATSAVASRPATPSSNNLPPSQQQQQPQPSAAERGLLRGAVDEKKLYSGYRSQTEKWLALAHIGQNFITISMRADTAVDFAREPQQ